jgi:hypothetical protein
MSCCVFVSHSQSISRVHRVAPRLLVPSGFLMSWLWKLPRHHWCVKQPVWFQSTFWGSCTSVNGFVTGCQHYTPPLNPKTAKFQISSWAGLLKFRVCDTVCTRRNQVWSIIRVGKPMEKLSHNGGLFQPLSQMLTSPQRLMHTAHI